ncbi:MAG: glycosyltransferase, partial [Chitinispirillaceae bacterium]|nr:glycosyltransferase [Chitinispirillaceae bacterium]
IGKYCTELINSIFYFNPKIKIYVWGEKERVPSLLREKNIKWISYKKGSWKSSIFILPLISLLYKIDIIHYWVALGPLREIGISPFTFVKSIGTIYDTGVEELDIPWCNSVRKSFYWRFQKLFVYFLSAFHTISHYSCSKIKDTLPFVDKKILEVIYMPLNTNFDKKEENREREPYFITLGGGIHKNLKRVVEAFSLIKNLYPQYSLRVLGYVDRREEDVESVSEGVIFEDDMKNYIEHLKNSSGLIFCSLYEGLGIPPLEAMQYGCPLILSSIPSLLETCRESAIFVDPFSLESIADGIKEAILNNRKWIKKSYNGAIQYKEISKNAGERCLQLYEKVSNKRIKKAIQVVREI